MGAGSVLPDLPLTFEETGIQGPDVIESNPDGVVKDFWVELAVF